MTATCWISSATPPTGAQWGVIPAERFDDAFFRLSSRIAGDIVQKFVNYQLGSSCSATSLGTPRQARLCRPHLAEHQRRRDRRAGAASRAAALERGRPSAGSSTGNRESAAQRGQGRLRPGRGPGLHADHAPLLAEAALAARH
ncbi:DUF4180 domain-containing protein [Salinactinospora qingdaonensis]|uniref:DUF4180 domain-containing protein n=1 Tax=Salinactinospora qingdaonensis TaxID=702744 RepID=UPI003CD08737